MRFRHYLQPLMMPNSVALIGASERPGSVGRIVYENMLGGDFKGEMYAVNRRHRSVLGQPCYRSLAAINKRIDLAVIAVRHDKVAEVLTGAGTAGLRAAVIISAPPVGRDAARRWSADIASIAATQKIRFVGPEAFGVIRTDIGLNATTGSVQALPGRLALIAQSGTVCSALLDFATPANFGFSSVIAVGDALDVSFGEALDALLLDPTTDAIVLYVERLRDPRRFLSALRTAARTKPVVVLKSGRVRPAGQGSSSAPDPNVVFDAALKRAGTVRVHTYTQLFAAARIMAMGKRVPGDRLAIVTNGHGPGLMAADAVIESGIQLAVFTPETIARLEALLPPESPRDNPLDLGGTADPARIGAAVRCVVQDENTDAVLALHTPLPAAPGTDAARAVANATRGTRKLVLAAWLGAVGNPEARKALKSGGAASFYTPENAVEAFSFLAAYGRNQQWLLEVTPPQPEPEPLDLAAAETIRERALAENRSVLTDAEMYTLLSAFGIPAPPTAVAKTKTELIEAARRIGFPVAMKLMSDGLEGSPRVARSRLNLRTAAMLGKAYDELMTEARERSGRAWKHGVTVQKMVALPGGREVSIGVYTDPVFGPVIAFGNGGINAAVESEKAVMLPPLNRRLALDLVGGTRTARYLGAFRDYPAVDIEPLLRMLLQLSTMVCVLPWVRELELNPVQINANGAAIVDARIRIDPRRAAVPGDYRHMAIHPYPVELVTEVAARDGTLVNIRPIRPEDAELEREFMSTLSEETRFFRFFHRLQELSPAMLARFTQIDYDREMALVAIQDVDGEPKMVGVARYSTNPDNESAEYAVCVSDSWQAKGVARSLMQHLIEVARRRGLKRLDGAVLRNNSHMLRFIASLGFSTKPDPDAPEQVISYLDL